MQLFDAMITLLKGNIVWNWKLWKKSVVLNNALAFSIVFLFNNNAYQHFCPHPAVVPWGEAPLPQHTYNPGGNQAGSKRRQGHHWEAEGEETLSYYLPARVGHG